MKWGEWLDEWGMSKLQVKAGFLNLEFEPKDKDRDAAWELYIELLTRITTQSLAPTDGDEATALGSVHALFGITRDVIKRNGRGCIEFTKIAIVVLNQVIRPFTAKWHRASLAKAFDDSVQCQVFREELAELQVDLHRYTRMLANMAGVEDLTALEASDDPHP